MLRKSDAVGISRSHSLEAHTWRRGQLAEVVVLAPARDTAIGVDGQRVEAADRDGDKVLIGQPGGNGGDTGIADAAPEHKGAVGTDGESLKGAACELAEVAGRRARDLHRDIVSPAQDGSPMTRLGEDACGREEQQRHDTRRQSKETSAA